MSGPVACTLGAEDHRDARERWQRLSAESEVGRTAEECRVVVRYAATPEALARLTELVALERGCCAWVEWELERGDDELVLTVSGDAFGMSTLDVP